MHLISKNPHLIDIIGYYEGDNTIYLAMEIFEGNSLYQEIQNKKNHRFTLSQTQLIMKQLLEGVKHLASLGIMHRDIKPDNIMIRKKDSFEELAIVDFGLAEFENTQDFLYSKCGTPGYAAPEVVNYQEGNPYYNSKCDTFSLGIIFHILITSRRVFIGEKYNDILRRNKECKIDFDDKLYASIPPKTLDLLKKLLAVDPEQRCTAQEALDHEFFLQTSDEEIIENIEEKVNSDHILEFTSQGQTDSQGLQIPNDIDKSGKTLEDKPANSFIHISQEGTSSFVYNANPLFNIHNSKTHSKSSIIQSNGFSNLNSYGSTGKISNTISGNSATGSKGVLSSFSEGNSSKQCIEGAVVITTLQTSGSLKNLGNSTQSDTVTSLDKYSNTNTLKLVDEVEEDQIVGSPVVPCGSRLNNYKDQPKESIFKTQFEAKQMIQSEETSQDLQQLVKSNSSQKESAINIANCIQIQGVKQQCDKSVDLLDPQDKLQFKTQSKQQENNNNYQNIQKFLLDDQKEQSALQNQQKGISYS